MSALRIAIAGGGIAGLTAALLLSRAGCRVEIFERGDRLGEVGAGLQVSPNAGRILDHLGLGPALDRVATRPEAIDMRSAASGRLVVSLPLARAAIRYGAPYRLLHRADLLAILAEAVASDGSIRLRLASAVSEPREADGRVTFSAGIERAEADLLVGADGVGSMLRASLPGASRQQPTGRTAWRTTIPAAGAPEDIPRDRVTVFLGDRTHVVVYPIRQGSEINVVAIVEEDWRGEGWSEPGDPAWLRARFHGGAGLLGELIEAAPGWTRWCLRGVEPGGAWQAGRVVLIGDAAHAMLPFLAQGAAMAIEDAAILARLLSASGMAIDAALAQYEVRRRPRVARVWHAARQSGAIYHMSPLAAPFRDATMRALGGDRLLARYDWIYGWRQSD